MPLAPCHNDGLVPVHEVKPYFCCSRFKIVKPPNQTPLQQAKLSANNSVFLLHTMFPLCVQENRYERAAAPQHHYYYYLVYSVKTDVDSCFWAPSPADVISGRSPASKWNLFCLTGPTLLWNGSSDPLDCCCQSKSYFPCATSQASTCHQHGWDRLQTSDVGGGRKEKMLPQVASLPSCCHTFARSDRMLLTHFKDTTAVAKERGVKSPAANSPGRDVGTAAAAAPAK